MITVKTKKSLLVSAAVVLLCSCGGTKKSAVETALPVGPAFDADSALSFCAQQCEFGPRTMNSEAHDRCADWIAGKFAAYGLTVIRQEATLQGYDGTALRSTNIIAVHRPDQRERVMVCAHWDSRPWADNDPDPDNWHTPVMAANDGASGVAVMLELARLLQTADSLRVGVDFICFDAEDWGTPQWEDKTDSGDTWALGAQYWAANLHQPAYKARYGILLDMVGGQGAQFFYEGVSKLFAPDVVKKVWAAADVVGYGSYFPKKDGGQITDDHVPVNQTAGIPCIDIIPYHPDCAASSFGPTWHTVSDDIDHLDAYTLKAVGQTLVQVLYSER